MKKLSCMLICLLVVAIFCGTVFFDKNSEVFVNTDNLLRIHIRANSNEQVDQNIKFKIKDEFVNFLTPLVANCMDKQSAIDVIIKHATKLEQIADEVLTKNNLDYTSKVQVKQEYFPTRKYENYVVSSGIYDAVIVSLGSASGNNWWCVVYPPLCFTNFTNSQNVVYKSKIMEIINKFFSKERT